MSDEKPSVREYMSRLGETSDAVAESLRRAGVRGIRKSSISCPLLVGIKRECRLPWGSPTAPKPGVVTYSDLQIMDPPVPTPVAEFMKRFDEGEYPELALSRTIPPRKTP